MVGITVKVCCLPDSFLLRVFARLSLGDTAFPPLCLAPLRGSPAAPLQGLSLRGPAAETAPSWGFLPLGVCLTQQSAGCRVSCELEGF